ISICAKDEVTICLGRCSQWAVYSANSLKAIGDARVMPSGLSVAIVPADTYVARIPDQAEI
ncbi:hypothetical protein ACC694_37750, partial [Rhizobium ruizarguesonis]